jgi:hypothetical protein
MTYLPNEAGDGCIWENYTPIDFRIEITFLVSLLVLCFSVFMLQKHIRDYAFNLCQRKSDMNNLQKQNNHLKKQLKE